MCREKRVVESIYSPLAGSPLRVQGKGYRKLTDYLTFRITPACAGKRPILNIHILLSQDHPCVCREKLNKYHDNPSSGGSPLRVQGKAYGNFCLQSGDRITPACAGKSPVYIFKMVDVEDHPCVCREK